MCGIVGYTGAGPAKNVLLKGLARLEYRGYDSAGVALADENGGAPDVFKTTKKVVALEEMVRSAAKCGIGHTRWATHGEASERNAHPHQAGRVTLVHNGIIENYAQLREEMARQGRYPESETDTEVAAMVIDACYDGDSLRAIAAATARFEGSYTFAMMFRDRPGELWAVCRNSPLVVMRGAKGSYLASDALALLEYGREYYAPGNGVIARLTADGIDFLDDKGRKTEVPLRKADWSAQEAARDGFAHFMLKEIHEQPRALRQTILPRVKDGRVRFEEGVSEGIFRDVRRAVIVGCGTAMHAGLTVKGYFEDVAGVQAQVEIASEFRYGRMRIAPDELCVFISQSGETADTLAALRSAQERGAAKVLAIVNARGSSLARACGNVIHTQAGPEIAVASTKAFTAQVAALQLAAIAVAQANGKRCVEEIAELQSAAEATEKLLEREKTIRTAAGMLCAARDIFYLGRGQDAALAHEGALKLKEISYIHAEAYAAGELKHGVISLIERGVPCVLLATEKELLGKAMVCAQEVRSRGGGVLLITMDGWNVAENSVDAVLRLPGDGGAAAVFPASVCLQLLAYECARLRGLPIDQPRNLAKSVTVE